MAIEEIGSDEERQTRLRRTKETLGMDDNQEVLLTRGSEGSDARGSRDPVAHPVETSMAHLTWCCGVMSLVDYSNQLRRKGKPEERASQLVQIRQTKATHELTHTSFRNWCSYCVRAGAAGDPQRRQPHKEPEFPIIMADYCFMQDAPGSELLMILD